MNTLTIYEALRPALGNDNAKAVADEIATANELDIQRLKEVFATKVELSEMERRLSDRIGDKINKIYWFLLGQTAILVGLILAILRLVDVV